MFETNWVPSAAMAQVLGIHPQTLRKLRRHQITPFKEGRDYRWVGLSTSTGHNNITLIRFTAEVTMGAALYAEWAKGGKFNMPGLSQIAEMANDQEALPHTTKYLNPVFSTIPLVGRGYPS